MLLGQLNTLSSLSQPRAEPGLLLLFEVVCTCGGAGEVGLLLEATCPTSRLCLLFLISLFSGAGMALHSSPLILSRNSECCGRSPIFPSSSPSFLGAAGLRFTWPFKDARRVKYGAPHRINEIPCTWQSKEVASPVQASLCQQSSAFYSKRNSMSSSQLITYRAPKPSGISISC